MRIRKDKGAVLLITLTIVTIVLALGVGIISIATKEAILSSLGGSSQKAFYAADTGIDCVLYWETQIGDSFDFATSSDSGTLAPGPNTDFCSGVDMRVMPGFTTWNVVADATSATTTFLVTAGHADGSLDGLDADNPCVEVSVTKRGLSTTVLSTGYSTCNTSAGRRVSRAVRIEY
jgi:Tfp pilus assembly protein PilX